MAKSCKEGKAGNRRRSGLEGHKFKTCCQQGILSGVSVKICPSSWICKLNIISCVRCTFTLHVREASWAQQIKDPKKADPLTQNMFFFLTIPKSRRHHSSIRHWHIKKTYTNWTYPGRKEETTAKVRQHDQKINRARKRPKNNNQWLFRDVASKASLEECTERQNGRIEMSRSTSV